jgi:hypothetical protein
MPPSVWNDATYQDLLVSLYGMIQPTITKGIQAQIVNDMAARGHNLTWEAIRFEFLVPSVSAASLASVCVWRRRVSPKTPLHSHHVPNP